MKVCQRCKQETAAKRYRCHICKRLVCHVCIDVSFKSQGDGIQWCKFDERYSNDCKG